MERNRDLFPLPSLLCSPFASSVPPIGSDVHVSRSVYRRVAKKVHGLNWCRDGVQALNELSGFPFSDQATGVPNRAQSQCLDQLQSHYLSVPAPPTDLNAAGAFEELCGAACSTRYSPNAVNGCAAYAKDLVSWPGPGTSSAA